MTNKTISIKNIITTLSPSFLRRYFERIESSPIGYRLAKGAFWSLAGALISRGLALLSSIIVARILGKEGFGELGIIQSTVGMFGVFAGFGLGMTATKYVAEFREKKPQKAGRIIALSNIVAIISGGIMAIILIILSPWLASNTLAAPHLGKYLQIGAGILFLSSLTGAQTGALLGFEAFKTIAKVNFWVGIGNFLLVVMGVYIAGLKGMIWGLIAGMGINWLLNKISLDEEVLKASIQINFRDCMQEWRVLWHFSFPAFLSGAIIGPVNWICNAMLVNQPNGYAEMGIFNAANQWRIAILFVPGIVGTIVLPALANLYGSEEHLRYKKVLFFNTIFTGFLTIFLGLLVILFAPFIMATYGIGFEVGNSVLILLSLSAVLMALNNIVGQSIASLGRMWVGLLFNVFWATMLVICAYCLIPSSGAVGLAWAIIISYILHSICQGAYVLFRVKNE